MKLVRLSKVDASRIRMAVGEKYWWLQDQQFSNDRLAKEYLELTDRLYDGGDIWIEEEGE